MTDTDMALIQPLIDDLLESKPAQKLQQFTDVISKVQLKLTDMVQEEDGGRMDMLRIGTVFQLFLVDVLAGGKKLNELNNDDWKGIAQQVYQHCVVEDEQKYSEFVFNLYADYIDVSADSIKDFVSDDKISSIKDIAVSIRKKTDQLEEDEISEVVYIEDCLWLSLEAMIKLLSSSLEMVMKQEYAELIQSLSQYAFEYGRYVMYAKESAILEQYIQNQRALDKQLEAEYKAYIEEVRIQAESFQKLIDDAFSANIHEALMQSAALARAAGVKEEELLTSVEDVDEFFMG